MADIRKLKDSVAEFLRKQKYDKVAEILEELVRAEPKDMGHRLKLGDAYRRLGIEEKAISCYRHAAKTFGDEGQLIKAIGALKVILEIEPKNEMAQRELADLNNRRFGKPTLESAGLRSSRGISAGARATSAIELAEGQKAADDIASLFETTSQGASAGLDDEPLELDEGDHSQPAPRTGVAPVFTPPARAPQRGVMTDRGAQERRGPAPQRRGTFELGNGLIEEPVEAQLAPIEEVLELEDGDHSRVAPAAPASRPAPGPASAAAPRPAPEAAARAPARDEAPAARAKVDLTTEITLDLDPVSELSNVVTLPDAALEDIAGAIQAGAVQAKGADEEEILELGEDAILDEPELAPAPRPAFVAPIIFSAPSPRPSGPPQPIADLLAGEAEEEIELLSISTDDELPPVVPRSTPPISASNEDLDAAFGAIGPPQASPPTPPPPKKLPPKVPLFDDLSQAAFVEFVNQVTYRRASPGEVIVHEGDPGRSFFVIVEGKVRVYKMLADGQELQLAELGAGAFFGEMALLSGAARAANVAATEETELLEVTDSVLRDVVSKHPAVATSLKNFYRQRLLNNVMTISPLFRDFDPSERKSIVERFRMKQGTPGEIFITEGKPSDGLYVVLHGAVRVTKRGDEGQEIELAKLKEGDLFGEMSLLTRAAASANVAALGPCIVLKLPREHWQELMLTHPQILELVSDLTEKRRSATEATLSGMGAGHDGMSFV